jgi:hypothetical protein
MLLAWKNGIPDAPLADSQCHVLRDMSLAREGRAAGAPTRQADIWHLVSDI